MAITSINLGKIKFNWKGAWALGTDYVKDDVVRYSGSSYVCVTGHTSATSWATNSSKFELMAEGTTPTTTEGDIIVRGVTVDERLGIGNSGQVLTVESGVPIWKDNGVNDKIYYVSPDGSDSNSGQSWGTAFATIKHACDTAIGPATVYVSSGTFYEALPITVPSFVAVVGDNQRTTIISPDTGYEQTTMWKLGDGALLNKMCFVGLTGYVPYAPDDKNIELATIGGVYVAFDSAVPIATKSPYIIECTAKSAGGVGALLDGSLHATGNKSMVFHGYTVILDSGVGYWVSDNAKSEIVSCFTYFCHVGYAATGGGKIRALNGNNSYGTYGSLASGYNLAESTLNGSLYGNQLEYTPASLTGGSFTAGETITGSVSGATGVIQNVQAGADKVYYKIATGGPFQVGETISNGSGVSAIIATSGVTGQQGFVLVVTGLTAEPKPGGSIEFTTGDTTTYVIQSVSGWTNSSSKAIIVLAGEKTVESLDGVNIRIRYDYSNIRLTGHDFLSIGTGGVLSTNYPGAPLQASAQGNEVIELFPARVFYVSTDQDGNFRVGEYFKVDQATGRATLNASAFDLSGLTSLKLGSIGAQLGELVNEFSSDETLSGNSNTAVPTEKATKQYFTKVSSNIVPSVDDLYTLGTPSKRWNHVYVGPGSLTVGTLTITDNAGTLEVKSGVNAAPTLINAINNGNSSVAVAANSDVTLTANGTTSATFSSTGVVIAGTLTVNGTTTTLNSNTLTVDDTNIILGSVASITGLAGTITSSATSSVVTGLSTTSGLIPGMALTGTAGTGAFGTSTVITTIDSPTQITVTGVSSHTAGGITFNAGGATDITANGGGITLKGTTDKTLNWVDATDAWTSSEDFNLLTGKQYKINGTSVLTSTTLGSGVTGSSLTSVGTLSGGLNIATGQTYKINSTDVLSATTLGSSVTGSSLTSVGTLAGGLDIATGQTYKINSTDVLSATTLGSGVTGSSLTSVGTLSSLTIGTTLTVNAGRSTFNANSELYAIGVRYASSTGIMYIGATDSVSTPSIQFSNSGGAALTTIDYSGNMTVTGGITVTGPLNVQQIQETLNTKTSATGTVVHDFSTGAVWWHSSISANFTANFTNLPTTANKAYTVSLILNQGGTGYYPSAVQINGSSVTLRWADNTNPVTSTNKIDVCVFTLIYTGSTWYVIGNYSKYA